MKPSGIPERLRSLRTAAGLSSRALSKLCGLSHSAIANIERDPRAEVRADTARKIADVFDASLDWLLMGEGQPPSDRRMRAAVDAAKVALAEVKPKPEAA